jgi:peptide/nickel transport system permease protein
VLHHAILPIAVLTMAYIPAPYAIMRTTMTGVLSSEFVRSARARGLRDRRVVYRHGLRNVLLAVVTGFALDLGQMLGGAVLIETVFNYRGLGGLMFEAVKSRDYPVLQGGFLLFTTIVLAINLITEWLYPRLDPRLREMQR